MSGPQRRWFVPEVVQTSGMDCGPATLTACLQGFGIQVSYGRLREACQTDVDGTSIDVLEAVAGELGLVAEQIMVPFDHVLEVASEALPSIAVVRTPAGATHFVIVWRRHGSWVQVMDPAVGRRWVRGAQLVSELYIHEQEIPADAWREWAGAEGFVGVLRARMVRLGLGAGRIDALLTHALADPGWELLGALDASIRMAARLVESGVFRRGAEAERLVAAGLADPSFLPPTGWSVHPAPPDDEGTEQVYMRGAILMRITGRRAESESAEPLSPELSAALHEPPARPLLHVLRALRQDGPRAPLVVLAGLAMLGAGGLVQTLLLRGLLDLQDLLGTVPERLGAAAGLLGLSILLVAVEGPVSVSAARMGRSLEARIRMAFLEKVPRLGDRYFTSRPASDMAERSHTAHLVRTLPDLVTGIGWSLLRLGLLTAAVTWLDPASFVPAVGSAVLAVALPLLLQLPLTELDLRMRTHAGALSQFFLDALLGVVALRTHSAAPALRRRHEELLTEWVRAARIQARVLAGATAVRAFLALLLSGWLFWGYFSRGANAAGSLLLLYWALEIPRLGGEISVRTRAWPAVRNVALRLLEPLGALDPSESGSEAEPGGPSSGGIAISLHGVEVVAAGHTILDGVDLEIAAGEHVAVVGPSGAGKSSLVGLLLGWHRAAKGEIRIDGGPLDLPRLARLREETAWVDPAATLWNRSLFENIVYGAPPDAVRDVGRGIAAADLLETIERLPDGSSTCLGEGGGLVSGGEGQRVRLARAMMRRDARLVVLDEAFRGLDRAQRHMLLGRARTWWRGATLLCVTHDVEETGSFGRVLVVDGGRIVEDGDPAVLGQDPSSRYHALMAADRAVRSDVWGTRLWRRWVLAHGRLTDTPVPPTGAA